MRLSLPYRTIAVTVLSAFLLTATVPFFCATGWCCAKHQVTAQTPAVAQPVTEEAPETDCCGGGGFTEIEAAPETDCCGGGGITEIETAPETDCCGGGFNSGQETADNSCGGSCATGCCKLAATSFVFAPTLSITILHPVATLAPATAFDTGIELSDYIPQPPRVLSA